MADRTETTERAERAGVGLVYSEAFAPFIGEFGELIDVVALMPETLWHERPAASRYEMIPGALEAFAECIGDHDVVLHGIGLSIGSDAPLDIEHVEQVRSVGDRFGAGWYSEHLAAFRVGFDASTVMHAGVGLPVPFDEPALRLLEAKTAELVARAGRPVLLENSAIYVEIPDADMTEAAFLNALTGATGCGVLLDLHNLVVNEINLGWDAHAYLDELDLETVAEVHVAGGEHLGRWYTDAHSGGCPERVWELLALVGERAPALRLVTFEMHESRLANVGADGLARQLAQIRSTLDQAVARVA